MYSSYFWGHFANSSKQRHLVAVDDIDPAVRYSTSVKMAEGELNVDSLISRLLEGNKFRE